MSSYHGGIFYVTRFETAAEEIRITNYFSTHIILQIVVHREQKARESTKEKETGFPSSPHVAKSYMAKKAMITPARPAADTPIFVWLEAAPVEVAAASALDSVEEAPCSESDESAKTSSQPSARRSDELDNCDLPDSSSESLVPVSVASASDAAVAVPVLVGAAAPLV